MFTEQQVSLIRASCMTLHILPSIKAETEAEKVKKSASIGMWQDRSLTGTEGRGAELTIVSIKVRVDIAGR